MDISNKTRTRKYICIVITVICIIIAGIIIFKKCSGVDRIEEKKTPLVPVEKYNPTMSIDSTMSDDFTFNDNKFANIKEYNDGKYKKTLEKTHSFIYRHIKENLFEINANIPPKDSKYLSAIINVNEGMFTGYYDYSELNKLPQIFSKYAVGPLVKSVLSKTQVDQYFHIRHYCLVSLLEEDVYLTFELHKMVLYDDIELFYSIIYDRDNNICGFTLLQIIKNKKYEKQARI